jgi:UDP-2,3-diacylglucosamine pyrophosphatase LpxH
MFHHYLVVSDLHLSDIEDNADGWKVYKGKRFLFDDHFAELLQRFCSRHPGETDSLVLLLNGDIFDFDIVTATPSDPPWPVGHDERQSGLNPTAAKSAWKLELIVSHHPRFINALAGFLAEGHRVVYILGNHDRELHFPEVQQVLLDALLADPALAGRQLAPDAFRFEPWFYYVPGELYVEHGHQFDYYTAFKNQLEPTVDSQEGPMIALPMGNLSNRYLLTRMGFFNPHASDYILSSLASYLRHWTKHYLFTPRSIVFHWLWGSLLVIFTLLHLKKKLIRRRGPHGEQVEAVAQRYGLSTNTVKQLNRLHRRPITNKLYRVVREFWLDRVFIMLLMTGGTITLTLLAVPLWVKLMVPLSSFPLLYFVYEWFARGENIFSVETKIPRYARTIARLLDVRLVSFGHTHRPRLIPLLRERTFVDTGAWAPITDHGAPDRLAAGTQNYLMVSFSAEETHIDYAAWR